MSDTLDRVTGAVGHLMWTLGTELGPLEEYDVLLANEPSFQPMAMMFYVTL